jgi:hypothetical protein
MTRIIAWGAGILAAAFVMAVASGRFYARIGTTTHKRTFLTFSRAVQVPGATLPAGTYVFRLATPDNQMVWQVLDASEHHVLASFFYVSSRDRTTQEQNRANGKPVVRFYETPRGVMPALKVLYSPWDSAGYVFLYPRAQAEQIAALTNQPVLATDSNPAKSPLAHVMTVQPSSDAAASQAVEPVEQSR